MKQTPKLLGMAALVLATLTMAACNKVAETSRAAESVTRNVFTDTSSSWVDFFTYNPPVAQAFPQTRYCYHMQSDIVCYDSQQPQLTSKLAGYQDGDNISNIQPGGGALGVSGGAPVAMRQVIPPRPIYAPVVDGIIAGTSNAKASVRAAANDVNASVLASEIDTGPVGGTSGTSNQISVQNLLPNAVQKR